MNVNIYGEAKEYILPHHFNIIKKEAIYLARSYASIHDKELFTVTCAYSCDKVMSMIPGIDEPMKEIIIQLKDIRNKEQAEKYLSQIKPFVIPFKKINEKDAKRLFPKVKKVKIPDFGEDELKEATFLAWHDIRLDRRFFIVNHLGVYKGIEGNIKGNIKGICSLCSHHEELGLFMANVKRGKETYTDSGNYICKDSKKCNQNILQLKHLNRFLDTILIK